MVGIIDYDAGNIMSVQKACAHLGFDYVLTRDRDALLRADHIILPGVGSFGDAMEKLHAYHLADVIREAALEEQIPLLGICLGLQLLFEASEESPDAQGLGLLRGTIRRIPDNDRTLKIPHMGWNSLTYPAEGRLFAGIPEGTDVYFVHSYYLPVPRADVSSVTAAATEAVPAEEPRPGVPVITAAADYGVSIGASVEYGNLFACQFHPEKSGAWGLKILHNFLQV